MSPDHAFLIVYVVDLKGYWIFEDLCVDIRNLKNPPPLQKRCSYVLRGAWLGYTILEAPFIIIIKSNSGRKQTQANILRKWRGQNREQIDGARGEGGREGEGERGEKKGDRQREIFRTSGSLTNHTLTKYSDKILTVTNTRRLSHALAFLQIWCQFLNLISRSFKLL